METRIIKLFLRFAISLGFLSAVADRFGMWPADQSAWGNWDAFIVYTGQINPWVPESLIPVLGIFATATEILFAVFLIIGFKTRLFARLSGILLLIFALSMTFSTGLKSALDYSVYSAAAAAFALSLMRDKEMETDLEG